MLRRFLLRFSLVLGVLASCWMMAGAGTGRSAGDPLTAQDTASIQGAIRGQLYALGTDDAATAFELATPSIRRQMGSAENFLRVIKEDYSPIYHHLVVIFSPPETLGSSTLQLVRLTDRDSRVWLAIYSMERDDNGGWQIDGCQLIETGSVSI